VGQEEGRGEWVEVDYNKKEKDEGELGEGREI
jgi:hypothetical protein